jgi:lipopolysaccharide biosynthesis glycosyltransferase
MKNISEDDLVSVRNEKTSENQTIVVACAADDKYAVPMAVTLFSLVNSLAPGTKIRIYVLSLGIGAASLERLRKTLTVRQISLDLKIIDVNKSALAGLPEIGHFGLGTFCRLLVPDLLPSEDKAIYLDSDLVIRKDIVGLWNVPLNDNFLLATQDIGVQSVSNEGGLPNWRDLGLSETMPYFNAGILVMNLKRWRNENLARTLVNYIIEHRSILSFPDQEALNAVCARSWGMFDLTWNVHANRYIANPQLMPPSRVKDYVVEHREDLYYQPSITHFSNPIKPWIPGRRVQNRKLWFDVLRRSRWFTPSELRRWIFVWNIRHYLLSARRFALKLVQRAD